MSDAQLNQLMLRIANAEARLKALEDVRNDPIQRIKRALMKLALYSAKFVTVEPGYYDLSFEQRAQLLNCTVPQLCKSIIFENTMHDPSVVDPVTNAKYYCVITQYIGKCNSSYSTRRKMLPCKLPTALRKLMS